MTELYEYNNHVMIYTGYEEPAKHKHMAAHILLSEYEMEFMVDNQSYRGYGIAIPSNRLHTGDNAGRPTMVFLFDSTTAIAKQILEVQLVEKEKVAKIMAYFREFQKKGRTVEAYMQIIEEVLTAFGIKAKENNAVDERIRTALYYIDRRIEDKIMCREVADAVFMSESRFSHLFRKEMGMTFAGYVQMRRLGLAYDLIIHGKNITDAANEAGFASSAHLAALNKKRFGLTISNVVEQVSYYRISSREK